MAIDYSQFFNPAAVSWGSWSPPARGMVAPQVAGSPMAPAPAGNIGQIPATPSMGSPPAPVAQPRPNPPAMPNPPATSLLDSLKAATAYGQSGYKGPTGDIGYGTGVGASGPIPAAPPSEGLPGLMQGIGKMGQNPNFAGLLQKAALQSQPAPINAPPLQMAQPVGPGNGPWQQAASAMQRPGVPNFAQPMAMFPGMLGGGRPF